MKRVGFALLVIAGISVGARAQNPKAIRVWGFEGTKPLMLRWEATYRHQHPDVTFTNVFHGAAAAAAGLYDGAADVVVMGREMWTADTMAFHWVFQHAPFGVEVLAAGPDAPTPSESPVLVVNRSNPLTEITMEQLDAVFGSEHKAAPTNIRKWSEMGVTGPLAGRAIHPVGFSEDAALGVYWRKQVLKEDYKPNPVSVLVHSDAEVVRRVASDPAAIGYASGAIAAKSSGVRVIAVDNLLANAESIATQRYPLTRMVSLYVNRMPEERISPEVEVFLTFCLSDEAQADVKSAEGYISLPSERRKRIMNRIQAEWTGKESWK